MTINAVLADAGWEQILNSFGFPVFALVVMGLSILYTARAVWRDVFLPLRDRFLTRINAFFDRMDQALDRMERRGVVDSATLGRHEDILWRSETLLEEVNDKCDRILSKTAGLPDPPPRPPRPRQPRPQQQPPPGPT